MRVFIDTNLWVYRLDKRQPDKSQFIAQWLRTLAAEHEIVISTQVLIELRSVLSCKFVPALPDDDIHTALQILCAFEVVTTTPAMVLDAHALCVTLHLSWFDALIAEAALRSDCEILYSEDFSHGQRLGSATVAKNPFFK